MNICPNYYQPNFTSRNNPVKPFTVNTKWGKLLIEEVNPREAFSRGFLDKMISFVLKNEIKASSNPFWKQFANLTPEKAKELKQIKNKSVGYYRKVFEWDDENTTLLVARGKDKKIQGVCLSRGFFEFPNVTNKACLINLLYVNEHLRGFKLGKRMMEKTINANKNQFTDLFLLSTDCSKSFYEKLGFKKLVPDTETKSKTLDFIHKIGYSPEYTTPYNMATQPDKTRWYDIAEPIQNI